jgi:lipoprotein-anchoring transpeptidase ErfK/SrfK
MFLPGAVAAQWAPPRPPAPAASGAAYGGGFIELLMTGQDPGPGMGSARLAPGDPRLISHRRAPPVEVYGADPLLALEQEGRRNPAGRHADPSETLRPQRAPDPGFERQIVGYNGREAPGTIVIDTPSMYLYLVQPGGQAVRYGIGVGRPGFTWAGVKSVSMKREWPSWTPPAQMLKRRPDLPRHMAGGPDNPLGARALYLGSSLYRIHGTNEPHTIGQNVSSGCIRMMNDDVIDLYDRVRVGARVIVS